MPTPLPQVKLKIVRRSSHPWIFQKMVEKPADRIPPGSVVDIIDREGQWVGRGFFNWHSRIALRLLTGKADEAIDADFFGEASHSSKRVDRIVNRLKAGIRMESLTDIPRVDTQEHDFPLTSRGHSHFFFRAPAGRGPALNGTESRRSARAKAPRSLGLFSPTR